jgi:protein arginine kinase
MKNEDFVISSWARLNRNVKGFPFPNKLSDERASIIASNVFEAVNGSGEYDLYPIAKTDESDVYALKEKGLISSALLSSQNSSAIIKRDFSSSVMINERDHVVISAFRRGLDVDGAYGAADAIDDEISQKVVYAFSDKLGYLTSSPSDVGTALKVGVTLFLPGITLTDSVDKCAAALSRIGVSLKAISGDGFKYVLSSVRTLGVSEKDICDKVKSAVENVRGYEEKARESLKETDEAGLKDKILRTYGIAANCYKASEKEVCSFLAYIKLGAYYGYLDVCADLDEAESGLLNYAIGKTKAFSGSTARDIYRAEKLKDFLKSK